jgi:hypothetical protein
MMNKSVLVPESAVSVVVVVVVVACVDVWSCALETGTSKAPKLTARRALRMFAFRRKM